MKELKKIQLHFVKCPNCKKRILAKHCAYCDFFRGEDNEYTLCSFDERMTKEEMLEQAERRLKKCKRN